MVGDPAKVHAPFLKLLSEATPPGRHNACSVLGSHQGEATRDSTSVLFSTGATFSIRLALFLISSWTSTWIPSDVHMTAK